jgi:hypothetical protein
MKKTLFTLAAVAALGFYASAASAQCAFDEPAKAKGIKSSMVKAMSSCPGITYASPNTSTMAGVPGCTSPTGPVPLSLFKFDDQKGKCDIKTTHKVETPCSDATASCSNLTLSVKCGGVQNADGASPNNDDGWNLNTVARATFDDNANGDMTVIDFPAQFALDQASKGKLKGKFDTNTLLNNLFGAGSALPACTAIELITVKIADPSGNLFATLGTSGR